MRPTLLRNSTDFLNNVHDWTSNSSKHKTEALTKSEDKYIFTAGTLNILKISITLEK